MIINLLLFIPIAILMLLSHYIFDLLNFDDTVSELAQEYLTYALPGSFCFVTYVCLAGAFNGC